MSNNLYTLLDMRGLVLQCYHSGTDKDAVDDGEGNTLKTPGHTLHNFVERYLLGITKSSPLNHIIGVWDAGNDYRKTLYPDYKAKRVKSPDSVRKAMNTAQDAVKQLLHSFGIPQVSVSGTEADDVIAYLVEKLPGDKLIYTVDGDLVALSCDLDEAPFVVNVFLKGVPASTFGEKQVQPRHVNLYKSLCGDTSDGYKGVPGFGPAAWDKLVEEYGEDGLFELCLIADSANISQLQAIIDAQPGQHKLLEKINNNVRDWLLSWKLAKLAPELVNAKVKGEFRRLRWEKRVPNANRLAKLTETTGTRYLVDQLRHLLPTQYLIGKDDMDQAALVEASDLFRESRFISLDIETWAPAHEPFKQASTGNYVDVLSSKLVGMGITCGKNLEHTFYFNFEHADRENNIDLAWVNWLIGAIPRDKPLIIQNAQFEGTVFKNQFGFDLYDHDFKIYDTQLLASHVDETESAGLKDLTKRWMNYSQIRYEDVIEKGKTMRDYPAEHVFKYGADDPLVTAHLFDLFHTITNLEGTWDFIEQYEFGAVPAFIDGYIAGVTIDYDETARQHAEDQATVDKAVQVIRHELSVNCYEGSAAVEEGVKNWGEELEAEFDAQPLKEGQEEEERQRNRLMIRHDLRKDLTYQEYVEEFKDPTWQFRSSSIANLAKVFELPEPPEELNYQLFKAWADPIMIGTRGEALGFIHDVLTLLQVPKEARTKHASYSFLRELYTRKVEAKVVKSGTELNFDSPPQNQRLFYGMLALPIRNRNFEVSDYRKSLGLPGSAQANEDALLMAIAMGDAPEGAWKRTVIDSYMKAKKAMTRIKFFYSKFPLWQHPIDGQVHPQFKQCGTETRRPSGSAPNMLQLGKRGDGVKVRRCILPNKKLGHDLVVSADFDGQELRLLAGVSKDPVLSSCYVGEHKRDPHSITGSGMAGLPYEDFVQQLKDHESPLHKKVDDTRKSAKSVNFLSNYGGGAGKLARKLLCPIDLAQQFLDAKKATYPRQEEWKAEIVKELHTNGCVRTIKGSVKHLYNKLNSSDKGLVSYYERAACNYMIQASCADILKIVLTNLVRKGVFARYGAVMYAPIYDEICVSIHSSNAVGFITELHEEMTATIPEISPVPMLANPSLGINFADQIEVLSKADQPLTPDLINIALEKALNPQPQYKEVS